LRPAGKDYGRPNVKKSKQKAGHVLKVVVCSSRKSPEINSKNLVLGGVQLVPPQKKEVKST
jgi:hypothetical protein